MGSWSPHFAQLDARSHFNLTLNSSTVRQVPWTQSNTTRSLIASLQLQQVQTLRTTHLTLGAFSLALALLSVHRILSDARRAAALQVLPRKKRFNALHNVHPAETFPLALASGAVLQQIIFVSVQSTTLQGVFSTNCRGLAMLTFPAIFLIGYITLVFGVEMLIRAFREERFAPRGKWNTTVCIAIVSFLMLLTWIPTVAWPMSNVCFGSLIWFPMRYDLLMLINLTVLVSSLLIVAALISIQLMRTPDLDHNERISASRMTYFLVVAALIYSLVIPVEVQSRRREFMMALAASRIAEISLFSSGMVITFFHLFLRTNATRMVIRPIDELKAPPSQRRPKIRFFGPSDLEMQISGPMGLQTTQRLDSRQGLIDVGPEKRLNDIDPGYFERPERALTPSTARSGASIDPTEWPLPPVPEKDAPRYANERNGSYSLFPTRAEEVPRLPATVYDPSATQDSVSKLALRRFTRRGSVTNVSDAFDFLTKPKLPFAERHQRMNSTDSSATVQIGLRFSVAPATLAAAKCTRVERDVPPLQRNGTKSSEESMSLPIQAPSRADTFDDMISPTTVPTQPSHNDLPMRAKAETPRTPVFSLAPVAYSGDYSKVQREKALPSPFQQASSPLRSAPLTQTAVASPSVLSGLRMNPITPTAGSRPGTPASANPLTRIHSGGSAVPSPTARIPLGTGTMQRGSGNKAWI